MQAKKWIIAFVLLSVVMLGMVAALVIYVDPFFHYHKPVEKLSYTLSGDTERYVNHGIAKNFDYDGIVTGTSMSDNFKCSQMDELFGTSSIKLPYFAATYNEINQLLETAFEYNDGIKVIVRGLDGNMLFDDKDHLSHLADISPKYLYDKNPFNDVEYWFFSLAVSQSVTAVRGYFSGVEGGITDFDLYGLRTGDPQPYPPTMALGDRTGFARPAEIMSLSDEESVRIQESITQNIVELAKTHPETEFYCFFTPYSIIWWGEQYQKGNISRFIEGEKIAIETVLDSSCDNLKLFGFCTDFDMTTDISNYRDYIHYGWWINQWMLDSMAKGEGLLTADNYEDYLETAEEFYSGFDYNSLFDTAAAG